MAVLKLSNHAHDIIETARSVVSQLELDKALNIVLKKAMELTKTKAGSIALFTPKEGTMRIRAQKGFPKGALANLEWKVRKGGLTHRILKGKSITVINNTTRRPFSTTTLTIPDGIKSLICVPLIHDNEAVGILYVDDYVPRKFSPTHLQSLEILASFASISIHHARTHSRVKRQAITDSLTGLFNRRYFEDILSRELHRAKRHKRELSIALVDVNDFKKYNDVFGHQAGDEALATLGEAIRKSVRSTDIAARYGGDEIVIILPETPLDQAYSLFSGRITEGIEAGFARIAKKKTLLSVSMGIAFYPRDGKNARELILAADKALLAAKKKKHARRTRLDEIKPLPLHTAPGGDLGLP